VYISSFNLMTQGSFENQL